MTYQGTLWGTLIEKCLLTNQVKLDVKMLSSEHEITISHKHQSYLKILDVSINDGETVKWAVIKKAYKKRALIVHPDKGGSENAFTELNGAFQRLERLIENGTEFEFGDLTEVSSSLDEMLNELKAHFDKMNAGFDRIDASLDRLISSLDRLHTSLDTGFSRLETSLDKLHATFDTGFSGLHASLGKLNDSVDRMSNSTQELHISLTQLNTSLEADLSKITAIDDKFDIDIPFYLGCYTVFLGSIVSAISGNHQPQNARSVGVFVFGAGLIATGGCLIANSMFKKDKPTPQNEANEQATELKLVNSTN